MKNPFTNHALFKRILSALVAGLFVFGVGYQFGAFGLELIVILGMLLSLREYVSLGFAKAPRPLVYWFTLIALMMGWMLFRHRDPFFVIVFGFLSFLMGAIWLTRNQLSNDTLLNYLTLGLTGQWLCILLPSFGLAILRLPSGHLWFALHLFMVFTGDVAAYFGGILFGSTKLMPQISPKKTINGALFGLAGAVSGAFIFLPWIPISLDLWQIIVLAMVVGFIAQTGDLTVSLLKRVAHVKDSGGIMPGHGGVLDRVDGVIFALPITFAFAILIEGVGF
jgi:phosphatidate cytidylyltransferase